MVKKKDKFAKHIQDDSDEMLEMLDSLSSFDDGDYDDDQVNTQTDNYLLNAPVKKTQSPEEKNSLKDQNKKKIEQKNKTIKKQSTKKSESKITIRAGATSIKTDNKYSKVSLMNYLILKESMNSNSIQLSIPEMAKVTSLSESSLKRHRANWIKYGWLKIIEEPDYISQKSATYEFQK